MRSRRRIGLPLHLAFSAGPGAYLLDIFDQGSGHVIWERRLVVE